MPTETTAALHSATVTDSEEAVLCRPVFIVGAPRSGTTWLQRLLLEHPGICGGQESHFFPAFGPTLRLFENSQRDRRGVGLAAYFSRDEFLDELRRLWMRAMLPLLRRKPGATLLLEKTPHHALWILEIAAVLPEARFVHLVRDSRAVIASLLAASRAEWGENWAPATVRQAARMWNDHVRAARAKLAKLPDDRSMLVHYEDFHQDTAGGASRVFDFLGLTVEKDQLADYIRRQDFEEQKRTGGTAIDSVSGGPAREPAGFFRSGRTDAWTRDLTKMQQLGAWWYTRRTMERMGYSYRGRLP